MIVFNEHKYKCLCSMTWKNTYVIYTDDHCLYTVCIHISEIRENGSKLLWVQYGTLSKIKRIGVQSNTLCFYTFYLLLCKTSLTLPPFIGVPVPRHENERLCICVCIFPLSTISRLNWNCCNSVVFVLFSILFKCYNTRCTRYVIKFVNVLWQNNGCLRVLQYLPPTKLTAII